MLSILEGYLLIPHELLHVVGYRLVGRKCRYRLGEPYVTPVDPMTRREQVVGLLFPFVVFVTLFLLLAVLSGIIPLIVKYQGGNVLLWAGLLGSLCLVAGGYACTAIGDLRQAYLLICNKPQDSQTPFDFLERWHTQLQNADRLFIFILIALCLALLAYTWLI